MQFNHPAVLYSAIRGLHAYPEANIIPGDTLMLVMDEEYSDVNETNSVSVKKINRYGNVILGGHIAKETSRLIYKWIKSRKKIDIEVYEVHNYISKSCQLKLCTTL